jgi:hypothetical protein
MELKRLHPAMLKGFNAELQKLADVQTGAEGIAVGALIGAALGGVGPLLLERLISKNRDIAIAAGALFGAGVLGSAGFVLGKKKQAETPPAQPQVAPDSSGKLPPHTYVLR